MVLNNRNTVMAIRSKIASLEDHLKGLEAAYDLMPTAKNRDVRVTRALMDVFQSIDNVVDAKESIRSMMIVDIMGCIETVAGKVSDDLRQMQAMFSPNRISETHKGGTERS